MKESILNNLKLYVNYQFIVILLSTIIFALYTKNVTVSFVFIILSYVLFFVFAKTNFVKLRDLENKNFSKHFFDWEEGHIHFLKLIFILLLINLSFLFSFQFFKIPVLEIVSNIFSTVGIFISLFFSYYAIRHLREFSYIDSKKVKKFNKIYLKFHKDKDLGLLIFKEKVSKKNKLKIKKLKKKTFRKPKSN